MSSGGSSMIRKITRGTSSGKGDVTISCSITDTNKVIVLIDSSTYIGGEGWSGEGVYLYSVTSSKIKFYKADYMSTSDTVEFSYQIIEFM